MNTYPEMDAKIVGILRLGDEPAHLYAAQRIEELEGALEAIGGADKATLARKLRRVNAENAALRDRLARAEARAVNLREARGLVAMAHDLAQQITYRANGDFREKAGRLELALVDAMSALSEASSDEGGAT